MCEECGCKHPSTIFLNNRLRKIDLQIPVLQANQDFAQANRSLFLQHKIHVINLISSPGSGKTTLLQALASRLGEQMAVIVGDLQTDRDAVRIRDAGCQAIQIETQGACHLDAKSVGEKIPSLDLSKTKLLVIENVGNLVCPASYDLGEHEKIALLSVTEGDDKVLKYPSIFSRISTLVITKIDLQPYVDFDVARAEQECKSLSPQVKCIEISAKSGLGMDKLFSHFLRQ